MGRKVLIVRERSVIWRSCRIMGTEKFDVTYLSVQI